MDQTPFHQDLLQGKGKMDELIVQHQILQNQVLSFAFFIFFLHFLAYMVLEIFSFALPCEIALTLFKSFASKIFFNTASDGL